MYQKLLRIISKCAAILFMLLGFVASDIMLRNLTSKIGFYDMHHLAPLFFTLFWSGILILIFISLPRKIGKISYFIVALVFNLYACGQVIYYNIFDNFIWFNDIGLAGEGADYSSFVIAQIDKTLISMFLFSFVCSLFVLFLFPKEKNTLNTLATHSVIAGTLVLFYATIPSQLGQISTTWDGWKNPRNIYEQFTNQTFMMQVSGFYEYIQRDFYTTYLKDSYVDENEYASIAEYLENKDERVTNSMSGIFKDKNVIVVMMESMDDWLVNETYTPTLSMMMKNGINFENHYAPIFSTGATFNSEFAVNSGSYSPNGGNAAYSFSKNDFSQSLPNLFKQAGYQANYFHYNTSTFYNRAVMEKAIGFDNYFSYSELVSEDWPEAGIDTNLVTKDEMYNQMVSKSDPFYSFVLTYTPHLPYSTASEMCQYAMQERPSGWDYSKDEEANCAQLLVGITDDFFTELLARLEVDGLLEDTVIVAYGDHYTYGISDKDSLEEMARANGAANVDEVPFFIYAPGVEAQSIEKVSSTIDILPTLANMFGLNANKYYIGNDLFDDRYKGLAYFSDYSWFDGKTYYKNDEVVFGDGSSDIAQTNETVMKNIQIGELIVMDDFFSIYNAKK